jgi:hypothetical protein
MSEIEISGAPAMIPPHYRFHWMGTHLKQEIVSFGGCQAIPQTWSVEG